ncbi:MAG: hypothetical protein ACLFV7_13385 [Phycisphaerae bacterium]
MLWNLWNYFGVIGILSILLWLTAVVVAVVSLRSGRRTTLLLVAVGIALVGWIAGKINSSRISDFRPDRSAIFQAARKSMEDATRKDVRSATADVQVAGDSDPNAEKDEFAYRRIHGKQERTTTGPADKQFDEMGFLDEREGQTRTEGIRLLPEEDVVRANRWDRLNLFFTRWVLLLAVLAVAVDYVGRFFSPLRRLMPAKKRPSVNPRQDSPEQIMAFLENAVRNGETFIYCAKRDPWSTSCLKRLPVDFIWPLEKITYTPDSPPFDHDFVFENAWFRRYCFVLEGKETAEGLLEELADFLQMRTIPRAQTPCPVHVVWEHDPPSEELLEKLRFYAGESRFDLILGV